MEDDDGTDNTSGSLNYPAPRPHVRALMWARWYDAKTTVRSRAYGLTRARCMDCRGLVAVDGDVCVECARPLCADCEYVCRSCRGCPLPWCSYQGQVAWASAFCECMGAGRVEG